MPRRRCRTPPQLALRRMLLRALMASGDAITTLCKDLSVFVYASIIALLGSCTALRAVGRYYELGMVVREAVQVMAHSKLNR